MPINRSSRRRSAVPLLTRIAATACLISVSAGSAVAQEIPSRLADSTFWRMITEFSEPGGSFRSDNFVSNEMTWQYVIPELERNTQRGGVYLGVGPDQNFTYITALKPKIAFIFDIRRQNVMLHLMYKAMIEMSVDRGEFLSNLFCRARPTGIDSTTTAAALFQAFEASVPDTAIYRRTAEAVKTRLTKEHGFKLSADDLSSLEYVEYAFCSAGPHITYNYGQGRGGGYGRGGQMPTYAQLMVQDDGRQTNRSYLGHEADYRVLRDLQLRNLIVPLVGDFGGPKAIRTVGKYLKDNKSTVTAFYLSNVEQYLFQTDAWRSFFQNVDMLPLDASSTFIRSVFGSGGFVTPQGGPRSVQMLAPMQDQVKAFNEGRIRQYNDVWR